MQTVKVYFIAADVIAGKEDYLYGYVSQERAARAKKCLKEKDRLLLLGAGYLIRKFVGGHYSDERGKPRSESVFFNVSHSVDCVGIALTENAEIGLDIEKSREESDDLAKYCLSVEEYQEYEKGASFLSLFVAKESLAKADGRGIYGDVKKIPALPLEGKVSYCGRNYFRHVIDKQGYFVSVTLEGGDFTVEAQQLFEIQ